MHPRLPLAALALVLALAGSAAARPAKVPPRTAYYDSHGAYLCAVYRISPGYWDVGDNAPGELTIETSGRRLEAHFTHHLDGWAVRVVAGRWNVFGSGNEGGAKGLYGRVVLKSRNHWTYSRTNGRVLGYTVGVDGPAAGTAALIFWWRDRARAC